MQLAIKDRIINNIRPNTLGLFDVWTENHSGKTVVVVQFASGPATPYYIRQFGRSEKGCFLRVGASAQPMSEEVIDTLMNKRHPIDLAVLTNSDQDLTFRQLKIFYEGKRLPLNDNFAKTLRLTTDDNRYNHFAGLLADENRFLFVSGVMPDRINPSSPERKSWAMFLLSTLCNGFWINRQFITKRIQKLSVGRGKIRNWLFPRSCARQLLMPLFTMIIRDRTLQFLKCFPTNSQSRLTADLLMNFRPTTFLPVFPVRAIQS